MHQRWGGPNRTLSSVLAGGEQRGLVSLPDALNACGPCLSSHLLVRGGGFGCLMVQMVWTQSCQSHQAADIQWVIVPGGRYQCIQIYPVLHLLEEGRKQWKSHDSAGLGWGDLDLLGSKHMPGCSSWRWASVVSEPVQHSASVCWGWGESLEIMLFRPSLPWVSSILVR
jgi:hypothetical protein